MYVCYYSAIGPLSSHAPNWFLSPIALQETGHRMPGGDTVTQKNMYKELKETYIIIFVRTNTSFTVILFVVDRTPHE